MTQPTKDEMLDEIGKDTEFGCSTHYEGIMNDGLAYVRKLATKDKMNLCKLFHKKGWIDSPKVIELTAFLGSVFTEAEEESSEEEQTKKASPKTTPKKESPKTTPKKASPKATDVEQPLTNKTKGNHTSRAGALLSGSFVIARNGIKSDKYDADVEPNCEFNEPNNSEDTVNTILQTFYVGDRLDEYRELYKNMREKTKTFVKKTKIDVDTENDKSIFTRSIKNRSINYKTKEKTTVERKVRGKEETVEKEVEKSVSHEIGIKEPIVAAINAYEDFGKKSKEDGIDIKLTNEKMLEIFDSQAINSINAFGYKWITSLKGEKGKGAAKGFNTMMIREYTHYRYDLVCLEEKLEFEYDDLFAYIERNLGPAKPVLNDMFMIEPYTDMSTTVEFAKKCVETFNNRNRICNYTEFTNEIRQKQWYAAMSNLEQITCRNVWQKRWLNILKSKFMYYIFMYNIDMADWLEKPLKCLIADRNTLMMAMHELYPISFLFTPYMAGTSNPPSIGKAKTKSRENSIKYFGELECDHNSKFLYYLLDKDDNDTCNKTLPIVEGMVESQKSIDSKKDSTSSSSDE